MPIIHADFVGNYTEVIKLDYLFSKITKVEGIHGAGWRRLDSNQLLVWIKLFDTFGVKLI